MNIKMKVVKHLLSTPRKSYTKRELQQELNLTKRQLKKFNRYMQEFIEIGFVIESKNGLRLNPDGRFEIGEQYRSTDEFHLAITEKGDVFRVEADDQSISRSGEKVLFVHRTHREYLKPILRLKENKEIVNGILLYDDNYFILSRDEASRITVPAEHLNKATLYDYVAVELFPKRQTGRIIDILPLEKKIDLQAILADRGIESNFSRKALKEAESSLLSMAKEHNRIDLRDELVFTIDRSDAMDLDDAISVKKLESDLIELSVHIADVSHYVKEGSILDKEAYQRGTSCYFIQSSIPMLPKTLSNNECSLFPGEDRFTLTVRMVIDGDGVIRNTHIYESVIQSSARFTYDAVSDFLEGNVSMDLLNDEMKEAIVNLFTVADRLKRKRIRKGTIAFRMPEAWVTLNEDETVQSVEKKERRIAHVLIEESMIATNEAVAKIAHESGLPLLFRSHLGPSAERLGNLNAYLESVGHLLEFEEGVTPKELQRFLQNVSNDKEIEGIRIMLLKTMQQATYHPTNQGHFGLASSHYTHFTSPIRRYADLFNHRVIKSMLNGSLHRNKLNEWENQMDEMSRHLSRRERINKEAENEFKLTKQVEWASKNKQQAFLGMIVDTHGLKHKVLLSNGVVGTFINRTDDVFSLGDEVAVCLKDVNNNNLSIQLGYLGRLELSNLSA